MMAVMGTRLDRDFSPAPPSSIEVERQELASLTHAISQTTDAASQPAKEWTKALGGVWVPWPQGAPEGYTNPPTPQASVTDVRTSLRALSDQALKSSLGPVATSIGIASLTLSATDATGCGDYDLDAVAKTMTTGVSVKNVETARQWLQWHAAHLNIGKRAAQLARLDKISDIIDAQLAAGAPDTRPAIVPEPATGTYVESAYRVLINQLAFSATHADADGKRAVASYICHLHRYADAPPITPLPGIAPAD